MVKTKMIFAAIAVVLTGILSYYWFFQGDSAKIRNRFKTMAELASKSPDEHELAAAINARRIGDMFADACRVEIPSHDISRRYSKTDIPAHIMGARSRYPEISLRFHDLQISFPEPGASRVVLTAYLETADVSGGYGREVHEVVCRLEKIEKDWFFTEIEVIPVLFK